MTSSSPVFAIGGLGGSGTRILAQVLMECGVDMGLRLNKAYDDLWFTALFKFGGKDLPNSPGSIQNHYDLYRKLREGQRINLFENLNIKKYMRAAGDPRIYRDPPLDVLWKQKNHQDMWGWKEPNTHLFVKDLLEAEPRLHYFHMIRDGRYMANSANQQQFNNWQKHFNIPPMEPRDRQRLIFWLRANERILNLKKKFPDRVDIVHYEELILFTADTLDRILGKWKFSLSAEELANKLDLKAIKPATKFIEIKDEEKELITELGYPHYD